VIDGVYPPSIRINRVGKTLIHAISTGFNKDIAYQHIQAGLEQLRSLGLGHGDIKVNNIFIDDNDIAFLDDLEYCASLGTIIPEERRPAAVTNVRKIEEFDAWRLSQLKLHLEIL
jgi:predicted unusual protein kinase regulating ubiquinone biosynthesis (AarF/ABC1/UbiB family)